MRTRRFLRRLTGRKHRHELSELGTSVIHRAVLRAIERAAPQELSGDHLDIGSGTGELLRLCAGRYPLHSFACDYTESLMKIASRSSPAPRRSSIWNITSKSFVKSFACFSRVESQFFLRLTS